MGQKIAVLVKSTASDRQTLTPEGSDCGLKTRRTIDGHQDGLPQATAIQTLKELSPCSRALPCHGLTCQEQLLSVPLHAQGHQHRDGGGPPIQPCLDHHALQQQMDHVFLCQAAVAPCFPVPLSVPKVVVS